MGDFPSSFGRYHLVERLALGGMAEVLLATTPGEHGFQKKIVIKRLLPHLVEDPTYNAMFIDEAKLTARLVHPKIAQTFELGKVDDALFIAMEYVDGIDVLALLREFAARRRKIDPQLAAYIAHEVLDALDYAHHLADDDRALGIVHRDISPSNVLLSVRGDVKLVDFGIARQVDPDRAHKSKSGTLKGKYGYMSPEQVIEQPLDMRSDVFSVGVVLAELLTGRRLFAAANELDVLLMVRDAKLARFDKYGVGIEANLSEIVRKALKKNVEERWQTAAQFRDAISEWLFDNRFRVTAKDVATVVNELRDSAHKRAKTPTAGGPDDAESEAPMIVVEEAPGPPPPSASASQRAETVHARPMTSPEMSGEFVMTVEADEPSMVIENRPPLPEAPPPPPPARAPTKDRPRLEATPHQGMQPLQRATVDEVAEPLITRGNSGVIDVPIADTISAAVEAITLPDSALATGSSDPAPTDDSAMRAFEDLVEQPKHKPLRLPTEEEAMRKRPPTPPALADIAEPPDDAGEFQETSPLRVLFRLMTARATGLLVVAVGGIKKEIYVRDGQPEYVSSNVASELFGNYLVTKGVLSDGELAMALAMMPHYGGKLGDTLVGLGLLKPLEVFRHLTRQVRTKIIDVCTWNKGGFGWYAGRENPREAFPLDFNAFEILGAGGMALSDDHIEGWIRQHASDKLRASRTRRVGPERFEVKGLVDVCDKLDGRKTVGELVDQESDRNDRLKIGRMLCLLEACDLAKAS